jgi:hypothetical protein
MHTARLRPLLLAAVGLLAACSADTGSISVLEAKDACGPTAFAAEACQAEHRAQAPDLKSAAAYDAAATPVAASAASCTPGDALCALVHSEALAAVCERHLGVAACDRGALERAERAVALRPMAADAHARQAQAVTDCGRLFPASDCGQLAERLAALGSLNCPGDQDTCAPLAAGLERATCAQALAGSPVAAAFCDLRFAPSGLAAAPANQGAIGACTQEPIDFRVCDRALRAECRRLLGQDRELCALYETLEDATVGMGIYCFEFPEYCAALAGRVIAFSCDRTLGLFERGRETCEFLFPQPPVLPELPPRPPRRPLGASVTDAPLCRAVPALGGLCAGG